MKKEVRRTKEIDKDREFAVILEKIHSDIKIICEDISSIKNRTEMLFEELGKQKESVFIIKADIRIIKTDIAEIKETLKDHSGRLTRLESIK